MTPDLLAVFWSKVRKTKTCWLWTGPLNTKGYGLWHANGGRFMAHRTAFSMVRALSKEDQLDHLCRVRNCVNPAHLEIVTNRTNVLRGIGPTAQNARKTHCPNGHEYSPENTLLVKIGNRHPERRCRECRLVSSRAYYKQHADEQRAKQRARYYRNLSTLKD